MDYMEVDVFYTIYKITNKIDGKIYVGKHQTKDLDDEYMGSGKRLIHAIKKYGVDNFTKEILHVFDNETDMNSKEVELVTENFCSREDTYNLCPGGKGGWGYINSEGLNLRTGMIHSEESRKKMGHPNNKNNLGRKSSIETKKKLSKIMSEKLKGKCLSAEHKKNISEALSLWWKKRKIDKNEKSG